MAVPRISKAEATRRVRKLVDNRVPDADIRDTFPELVPALNALRIAEPASDLAEQAGLGRPEPVTAAPVRRGRGSGHGARLTEAWVPPQL